MKLRGRKIPKQLNTMVTNEQNRNIHPYSVVHKLAKKKKRRKYSKLWQQA